MGFLFGKRDKAKSPEIPVRVKIDSKADDRRLQKEIAANKNSGRKKRSSATKPMRRGWLR